MKITEYYTKDNYDQSCSKLINKIAKQAEITINNENQLSNILLIHTIFKCIKEYTYNAKSMKTGRLDQGKISRVLNLKHEGSCIDILALSEAYWSPIERESLEYKIVSTLNNDKITELLDKDIPIRIHNAIEDLLVEESFVNELSYLLRKLK